MVTTPPLGGPFDLIMADCPWVYSDKASAGDRGAAYKYPLLTLDDLCALDVPRVAAPDANLLLWATSPLLPEALRVMAAWGFSYRRVAFVWRKVYPSGRPFKGMGHGTRGNTEYVLEGIRGRGCKRVDAGVEQEVTCARGDHSAKPAEVGKRLVRLYGPQRRLELFARCPAPGWTCTGLDLDGQDVRAVLGVRSPEAVAAALAPKVKRGKGGQR
jgi:N6-adenosine-specific RNA methylase IME4